MAWRIVNDDRSRWGLVTGVTIVEPSAPPDNGRSSFCKAIVPRLREAASTYDKLAWPNPEGGRRCAEDGVAAGPEWSRGVGFGPRHTTRDTMADAREGAAGTWWRV